MCIEEDERRAAMLRFRRRRQRRRDLRDGLRNAVGFDWQPGTGELYATDNGRDLLGDDFPPCELNRVVQGGFYGWPFANGDRGLDPDFGAGHEARDRGLDPAGARLPRHNAPLGIAFLHGASLPDGLPRGARSSRCTARGTARARTATRSCRSTGTPTARSASATS